MNLAKADKFVDPGFLMHWGEDMVTLPGSGGASCAHVPALFCDDCLLLWML
jgi:hypothetical protein